MLLTPRAYQLASAATTPSEPGNHKAEDSEASPFIRWAPGWRTQRARLREARRMLLVHQTGNVKVGEVVRYTVSYEPSADRILPSPQHLFVRIKNTAALPLRAAYLHGPYTLHTAVYPDGFNPNRKVRDARRCGTPQFEPNLKAGGTWNAKIPVPEEMRVTGSGKQQHDEGGTPKQLTWIIEITSQIIFSSSASVSFELLVSRDERTLDYNFNAVSGGSTGHGQGSEPGHVHDHQQDGQRKSGRKPAHTKGVYSKAVHLIVDNTESLWNTPPLPQWEEEREVGKKNVEHHHHHQHEHHSIRRSSSTIRKTETEEGKGPPKKKRKKKKLHLVILTHGLHSNLSADLLFMKESIDAAAEEAKESRKRRREERRAAKQSGEQDTSEEHHDDDLGSEEDDDEDIMVRGFTGNAVKTENGIQYLGKRMAKYILDLTYPDQPYRPIRRSMSEKISTAMSSKKSLVDKDGKPTHAGSTIRMEDVSGADLAYTFSKISFIGHSLGGLIQLYAIGYIQKHAPHFFDHIEPVNFVALATPFLGLSNENPMYVKFALDFGLVGRTGQDLGLTWRAPSVVKTGWSAMGFGGNTKDPEQPDPGAKPLLRILPTGPAHQVLRRFWNRTVYSNVVNDGIVPLRTSCLLFLDWKGLNRVEKARRENGIIGTVANWGWSELTGASSSAANVLQTAESDEDTDSGNGKQGHNENEAIVPQPSVDETNQDYQEQRTSLQTDRRITDAERSTSPPAASRPLDGIRNFLGLTLKTSKKDVKMYQRSQTSNTNSPDLLHKSPRKSTEQRGRPGATRGDSIIDDPNSNAPPKTSIFESAGDILNPPIPPQSWITDPSSRARTIFHDRVYHPEDIPPPAVKRQKTKGSTFGLPSNNPNNATNLTNSGNAPTTASDSRHGSLDSSTANPEAVDTIKVEEKIARAYHKDLSWRKVLVRLEPDAHNNMIVRRMFANAYGWPVVKHLCDTHFADTYAARTRDEREPATDRAKGVEKPVGETGEHVQGQEDGEPPEHGEEHLREEADELKPLKMNAPKRSNTSTTLGTSSSSYDSYDERYYLDNQSDEEDKAGGIQRFFGPSPLFGGGGSSGSKSPPPAQQSKSDSRKADDEDGFPTSQAEIADFLSAEPPVMEGHRGLEPVPMMPGSPSSTRKVGDVGLKKVGSLDGDGSVGESVARSVGGSKVAKRADEDEDGTK